MFKNIYQVYIFFLQKFCDPDMSNAQTNNEGVLQKQQHPFAVVYIDDVSCSVKTAICVTDSPGSEHMSDVIYFFNSVNSAKSNQASPSA